MRLPHLSQVVSCIHSSPKHISLCWSSAFHRACSTLRRCILCCSRMYGSLLPPAPSPFRCPIVQHDVPSVGLYLAFFFPFSFDLVRPGSVLCVLFALCMAVRCAFIASVTWTRAIVVSSMKLVIRVDLPFKRTISPALTVYPGAAHPPEIRCSRTPMPA